MSDNLGTEDHVVIRLRRVDAAVVANAYKAVVTGNTTTLPLYLPIAPMVGKLDPGDEAILAAFKEAEEAPPGSRQLLIVEPGQSQGEAGDALAADSGWPSAEPDAVRAWIRHHCVRDSVRDEMMRLTDAELMQLIEQISGTSPDGRLCSANLMRARTGVIGTRLRVSVGGFKATWVY